MSVATVRVWNDIRSFHLEFNKSGRDELIVYRKKSYDFHADLLDTSCIRVRRLGTFATCVLLLRYRPAVVELNEPLMVPVWPRLLVLMAAAGLLRVMRPGTVIAAYAIENLDPVELLRTKLRLPAPVIKAVVWLWLRSCGVVFTRLAFGTAMSRRLYESRGFPTGRTLSRTIEQLPDACTCGSLHKQPGHVLFVGAFDGRKGARELVDAWSVLQNRSFDGRLTMIGDGPDFDTLAAQVEAMGGTPLRNPPRADIHSAFREARVLVLLSQPQARWREQVGLPILEGLGHGAIVVASAETGLADWLRQNGHVVVSPSAPPGEIAAAIRAALNSPMSTEDVLGTLPARHGRSVADEWLTGVT